MIQLVFFLVRNKGSELFRTINMLPKDMRGRLGFARFCNFWHKQTLIGGDDVAWLVITCMMWIIRASENWEEMETLYKRLRNVIRNLFLMIEVCSNCKSKLVELKKCCPLLLNSISHLVSPRTCTFVKYCPNRLLYTVVDPDLKLRGGGLTYLPCWLFCALSCFLFLTKIRGPSSRSATYMHMFKNFIAVPVFDFPMHWATTVKHTLIKNAPHAYAMPETKIFTSGYT